MIRRRVDPDKGATGRSLHLFLTGTRAPWQTCLAPLIGWHSITLTRFGGWRFESAHGLLPYPERGLPVPAPRPTSQCRPAYYRAMESPTPERRGPGKRRVQAFFTQ